MNRTIWLFATLTAACSSSWIHAEDERATGTTALVEASRAIEPTTPVRSGSYDSQTVAELVALARQDGNSRRGVDVFCNAKYACQSCHQVGDMGGTIGPNLTTVGKSSSAEEIAASILWPRHEVKSEYRAWFVLMADGTTFQGYKRGEEGESIRFFDTSTQQEVMLLQSEIDDEREIGTLMPDNLLGAMTFDERRDLLRFLMDVGRDPQLVTAVAHGHEPASFEYSREPLRPADWPSWRHHVNRDRVYDFYEKEAAYFRSQCETATLLPAFPGIDGEKYGHWGNQDEIAWADDRWNSVDVGTLLSGVFFGPDVTVPKGVCIRLGDAGELAACFNPQSLCYEALWRGKFLSFSSVRHGFLDGLRPAGEMLERPEGEPPAQTFVYRGFYRYGKRVVFAYRVGDTEMLDAPWVKGGKFERSVAPASTHPLKEALSGGPPQWAKEFLVYEERGTGKPYAVDTIPLPTSNPWKMPVYCGDHAFLSDGSALVCTMHGDVWRATGIGSSNKAISWRRFASGLHQALGIVVHDDEIYVLGRDQITRLHDLNRDGEADFYECVSNAMLTSPSGHDFICGLARDREGRFYASSSSQGVIRISADGRHVDVLATGLRNPDGLHLTPDGAITVPNSEGEWTPASMVHLIPTDEQVRTPHAPLHFGYGGPRNGKPPALPLAYLPRGLDNSSGAQTTVPDGRWGPLTGKLVHLSYGAGRHFLLLRDEVEGQAQGAIVPLIGEFRSGAHRARFNPHDGQLYVTGMGGWGTYTSDDGCFHRVRYTGGRVQLPSEFHVHENGVLIRFTSSVDAKYVADNSRHFAQAWNYRYSQGYGSPEFSTRHLGVVGHDALEIKRVHLVDDRTVFVELPELQPVNTLHLALAIEEGNIQQIYVTVHKLDAPFTQLPDYRPTNKVIAAHPLLGDLAALRGAEPNPWLQSIDNARAVEVTAGKNLTFAPRTINARPGEPIRLTFHNPDAVPHNWVLIKPGQLAVIGDLTNRLIADPNAVARQYVPQVDEVIAYTDIVGAGQAFTIYFQAPEKAGRYPFLCTFPGHWMVMNGELLVE